MRSAASRPYERFSARMRHRWAGVVSRGRLAGMGRTVLRVVQSSVGGFASTWRVDNQASCEPDSSSKLLRARDES